MILSITLTSRGKSNGGTSGGQNGRDPASWIGCQAHPAGVLFVLLFSGMLSCSHDLP